MKQALWKIDKYDLRRWSLSPNKIALPLTICQNINKSGNA